MNAKSHKLAYVIRKDEAIQIGHNPVTTYLTKQDEMIMRAHPHCSIGKNDGVKNPNPAYPVKREKVWDIISAIAREHLSWKYDKKPAQGTMDRRMTFQNVYQHFLGPNYVNNMATQAEDKPKLTIYNCEQCCWEYERYVNMLKQQYLIMQGTMEHGHTGIDPCLKVRNLLDGIKTDILMPSRQG